MENVEDWLGPAEFRWGEGGGVLAQGLGGFLACEQLQCLRGIWDLVWVFVLVGLTIHHHFLRRLAIVEERRPRSRPFKAHR